MEASTVATTEQLDIESLILSPRASSSNVKSNNSSGALRSAGVASKYDYVKVRVWIDDHFYVFSRYLVYRSLIGTKISDRDAVKISLELKKILVDTGKVDITQPQFEDYLYRTMVAFGYGNDHIQTFRMMNKFNQARTPLIVLISGTRCIGKSTIATKLAERMNIPNVFQTDIVFDLVAPTALMSDSSDSFWKRKHSTEEDAITGYRSECAIVREGVDYDIMKALKDGKPVIIEGIHVDPSLYLPQRATPSSSESVVKEAGGAKEKSSLDMSNAIIVPFVLSMNHEDHSRFLHANFSPHVACDYDNDEQFQTYYSNFVAVQKYLLSQESGVISIPVNSHSFDETVDYLHTTILQRVKSQFPNFFEYPGFSEA